MHEAVAGMISRYECRSSGDYINALREIMQEIALLGLWRSKFFEHAAFYGGTALRVLHGLDRYSEDMDFTLLEPDIDFDLGRYGDALTKELSAFGFEVRMERKQKIQPGAVQSAFLKADTYRELLVIEPGADIMREIPQGRLLKIKLEVDTNPPGRFSTETQFLLQPIPFAVRTLVLPDLFAGKMHAALCRQWKKRVKGRDWYDLVWYVARGIPLNLEHLTERMRQSGHWSGSRAMTPAEFQDILNQKIRTLDVVSARRDVEPFLRNADPLAVWSQDFFHSLRSQIQIHTPQ
jgi:hypothetical protein